jgi:hypothetical protein
MKKIILLTLLSACCYAQKTVYNSTKQTGLFTEYQTKEGNTLKIGDSISISTPKVNNYFTFITQGNVPAGPIIANTKIAISKIRNIGTKKRGFKTFVLFGGYGLSVYIDYESALEIGEIKNPFIQ